MPVNNVMFIGKMASGKTTAANYLANNFDYRKYSLASPVKFVEHSLGQAITGDVANIVETCKDLINKGIISHSLKGDKMLNLVDTLGQAAKIPYEVPKPRKRLQFIGTELRNRVDKNIWVNYLAGELSTKYSTLYSNVIDDVRFKNEYEVFSMYYNFKSVKLEVSKNTQLERLHNLYGICSPEVLDHPSETELDRITPDITIDAEQPFEEMMAEIIAWLDLKNQKQYTPQELGPQKKATASPSISST